MHVAGGFRVTRGAFAGRPDRSSPGRLGKENVGIIMTITVIFDLGIFFGLV
jgi:hypothetical protein